MFLTILGITLRIAELVFAAIVAGVTGAYLHDVNSSDAGEQARFIYTEIVAALGLLFGLLWLLPLIGGFGNWPGDIFLSALWWIAFGVLVDVILHLSA